VAELGPQTILTTWELGRRQDPLERAVTLLASTTGTSREDAAGHDVGTRDVQLARAITALRGGSVPACAACACGEVLDVAVDVAAVASWPVQAPGAVFEAGPDACDFRLPNTRDLQALDGLDVGEARERLVARCTADAEHPLSPGLIDAVDAAMEGASPAGAVQVLLRCPACDTEWEAALDLPALLWAEVEARALGLLREVHALAVAYGWTEAEVLALPAQRRATYLQLATS
jgi:hypothetical protein